MQDIVFERGRNIEDYIMDGRRKILPKLDSEDPFTMVLKRLHGENHLLYFQQILDQAKQWRITKKIRRNHELNKSGSIPDGYLGTVPVEIKTSASGNLTEDNLIQIAKHCQGSRSKQCLVLIVSPKGLRKQLFCVK